MEKLGQAFLVAGYLPAALFVLAHQLVLFPRWLDQTLSLFQTTAPDGSVSETEWSYLIDQGFTVLLLPLLLGVLLMALNTIIIRLYEGAFGWQRRFLLRPWQRRNERRAKALYGELVQLKQGYTHVLADLSTLQEEALRTQLEQSRANFALQMQDAHNKIIQEAPVQRLPRRVGMVKPTALGNAFAISEEYAYERYGMDGVLFWPRLRPLLEDAQGSTLTNTKMVLDLLLNLSLLALVFGAEAWVVGVWGKLDWTLIGTGIGAWVLAYVCYQGAVGTAYGLGDTIALCFDLYRDRLWKQFGFPSPKNIEEEQSTWLRLGQFLRLGEGFYYPRATQGREEASDTPK